MSAYSNRPGLGVNGGARIGVSDASHAQHASQGYRNTISPATYSSPVHYPYSEGPGFTFDGGTISPSELSTTANSFASLDQPGIADPDFDGYHNPTFAAHGTTSFDPPPVAHNYSPTFDFRVAFDGTTHGIPAHAVDMAVANFSASGSDSWPSAEHAQTYIPVPSNGGTPGLGDAVKAPIESLIQYWILQGVEPWENPIITSKIAAACQVDKDRVWMYYNKHYFQRPGSTMTPTVKLVGSAQHTSAVLRLDQQPDDVQQRGRRIVHDYVAECHGKQQCSVRSDGSRSGKYTCIWGCNLSFPKELDWRRHIELRRPQQVYVCCLCMSADLPRDKIFASYRKDKIQEHVNKKHRADSVDVDAVIDASHVPVDDPHRGICSVQSTSTQGRACAYRYDTYSQYFKHFAGHFKQDHDGTGRATIESASGPGNDADVLLRQTSRQTTTTTRRQASASQTRASKRARKEA